MGSFVAVKIEVESYNYIDSSIERTFQFREPPRVLDLVFGTDSDCRAAGGLGASLFSNGLREALDLDL